MVGLYSNEEEALMALSTILRQKRKRGLPAGHAGAARFRGRMSLRGGRRIQR